MTTPIGMVAGEGDLALDLARRAFDEGNPLFVVRLKGMAAPGLLDLPGGDVPVERPASVIAAFQSAGCRQIFFCGKVLRPQVWRLALDPLALKALFMRLTGVWSRDDSLHRAIARLFEDRGISVIGPADIWPDLLAPAGRIGAHHPSESETAGIALAAEAALRVGATERGQGAVARAGAVIAIEDRGHTDGLLQKVADAPGNGGVLVKLCGPAQDRRFDLPVIGPETVKGAVRARLAGIVVEAGGAIIARRTETIRAADAAGIFLVGRP